MEKEIREIANILESESLEETKRKISHSMKLLKGKWSRKHEVCIRCGTNDNRYQGKGYCCVCYEYFRWLLKKECKDG